MDPLLDARLKEIEARLERIDERTKKIRSAQRSATTARYVYWLFIILLGLGAFYFLQPYIEQLKGLYTSIGGNADQLDQLLDQFKTTN